MPNRLCSANLSLHSHERPAAVAAEYRHVPVLDPRVGGRRGVVVSLVFRLVPDRVVRVRLDIERAKRTLWRANCAASSDPTAGMCTAVPWPESPDEPCEHCGSAVPLLQLQPSSGRYRYSGRS